MVAAYKDVDNLSLIIQPGDSFFPLVDAIESARQTIKMTIFRMDDPVIREAMKQAVSRGVQVQALVAPESKGWNKRNRKLGSQLAELGIDVAYPAASKRRKERYHNKMIVIDSRRSLLLTFNPTRKNLHYARDFGLSIKDPVIALELERLFDADWQGKELVPQDLPLVISPDNSRLKITQLLNSAVRSIQVMDAKVWDPAVLAILASKSTGGCDVRIIGVVEQCDATRFLDVRHPSRYKLHAKCIVVDGLRMFIGSQNLRRVSLDRRREVGIIIEDEVISRRVEKVFEEDWNQTSASL